MATKQLGQRILSLSSLVAQSSEASSQQQVLGQSTSWLSLHKMNRTCHGCHALIDEFHKDIPSGWQKCPLEHWSGCKGGIAEGKASNGSEWRGCPSDYVYVEAVSTDEEDLGAGLDNITIITEDDDGKVEDALQKQAQPVLDTNLVQGDVTESGTNEDVVDDTLVRQLEEANLLLKQQVAVRAKQEEEARVRKVAMLRAENLRLSQVMGGDIGGAKIKVVTGSQSFPHPKNKKRDKVIPKPVQDHMSRRSLRAAEFRP